MVADLAFIRPLLPAVCVLGLVMGGVWGLELLKKRVYAAPEQAPRIEVELTDVPSWVEDEGWKPRILGAIHLPEEPKWLDESLIRTVHDQLKFSGWVSRIDRVAQGMDGKIRIFATYRKPVAMISFESADDELKRDGFVAVDAQAVRLPDMYEYVDPRSGWIRVLGVDAQPPQAGEPYTRDDVAAAVRLAYVIGQQPFARQISAVNVRNFGYRHDRAKPQIVLLTPSSDDDDITWGSPIGEEIEEPDWRVKVRNLQIVYEERGSLSGVNVSIHPDSVIIGPKGEELRTADGSRPRD